MPNRRKNFSSILEEVAGHNAAALETRARQANWLAHRETKQSDRLFEVKHSAVSQLFVIPGFAPIIQTCECTPRGLVLSIKLTGWGQLHVPLNRLAPQARKYVLEPRTRKCRDGK